MSARGKKRPVAAEKINLADMCQSHKGKQSPENTGLDVGKNARRIVPLTCRKLISVGVKRKADNSKFGNTKPSKHTHHLSNESLETDTSSVDSDTDSADEKTHKHQSQRQENMETSSVHKYDCVLHDCIQSHSVIKVIKLLKKSQPFCQDDLDKALILACQRGHKYIVQKLIDHGANVQCRDSDGNTPLMICSKYGFIDLVQFLLTRKHDINAVNSAGDTALLLGIRPSGSTELTKLFVQNKRIYVDFQNEQGYTALMKAVELHDIGTAYILLKCRFHKELFTDPWRSVHSSLYKNCKGETAADIFEKHGLGVLLKMLKARIEWNDKPSPIDLAVQACDVESLNLFLDNIHVYEGIKTTMISNAYTNFFEHAFQEVNVFSKSHISMVKRLLELGATLSASATVSPMFLATKAGSYALVELLCQHGASRNHPSWVSAQCPLLVAARMGRCDLLKLLLTFRVDVNQSSLCSALDCAKSADHTDCVDLLVRYGTESGTKVDTESGTEVDTESGTKVDTESGTEVDIQSD
ncbi:hypothetical protein BsWGS_26462 [Bradybaena similaris]